MESRRQLQVAELVKRNFSMVLHQEGGYIYGSEVLVSVTQVYITPDSSIAKIYVSVYNTESKQAVVDLIRDHMVRLKQLFTRSISSRVSSKYMSRCGMRRT
ncbi:MAG: ribosome-binding factor A [Bacteroidota bacterium]